CWEPTRNAIRAALPVLTTGVETSCRIPAFQFGEFFGNPNGISAVYRLTLADRNSQRFAQFCEGHQCNHTATSSCGCVFGLSIGFFGLGGELCQATKNGRSWFTSQEITIWSRRWYLRFARSTG